MKLSALLSGHGLGARLEAMLSQTQLGTVALGDYMRDPDGIIAWMLRQPNCGRKTANELVELIGSMPLPQPPPPTPLPEPPLADVELGDLLAADERSARLGEVMRLKRLRSTRLTEYVSSRDQLERWMLQLPNCGRRSVTELRGLVAAHIRRQLEAQKVDPEIFGADFAALVASAAVSTPGLDAPPPACDLKTLLEWHLARLPKRTAEVIGQRFGLVDGRKLTLEAIGLVYKVTRERIRQIEAKGLKAMKRASLRFPLDPLVQAVTPRLLATIFGERLHATGPQADRRLAAIDGWHELAMQLTHGGATSWLAASAIRLGDGWLAPGADPVTVKAVADMLKLRSSERPFPRSLEELRGDAEPALASASIDLLLGWSTEAGYVFRRRPGPRLKRAAHLHALLSEVGEPMETVRLLGRYHELVRHDRCADRDIVIVMEATPHLFLEIHEGCWTALGFAASPQGQSDEREGGLEDDQTADPRDESTNATSLERELARVGPSRMGELMNRAVDILPEGRSRHSIGPTLLSHPSRFVRVLPGVYALPDQVLDGRELIHAGEVEYLLNPTQARFYAVGRKAGERWGAYPLWTPTAEMRLCRWARAGDERSLYRSLLEVATIDDWPTDDADKDVWRDLRNRDARYELWAERRPGGVRPPIERVLAAAIRLRGSGTLGWVAANRILGYVPSAYAGAGLLASMVAAGLAVEPAGEFGWQMPHGPGRSLGQWVERLSAALHEAGDIDWETGVGAELARDFTAVGEACEIADEPDGMDEFELIMAEHRRSMQARRAEAQLELRVE